MNNIYELILFPEQGIYRLIRFQKNLKGFWIALLAVLSVMTSISLVLSINSKTALYMITYGTLIKFLLVIFFLAALTAVYRYFAGFYGGIEKKKSLFQVILYSLTPFVFATPAALVLKLFSGRLVFSYTLILLMVLLFSSAYYQFKTIEYYYGLSRDKALTVFVLPYLISVVMVVSVTVVLVLSIISWVL